MALLTQSELDKLTPAERLALISQLWESLDSKAVPLTEAQCAELDRRLETLEEDRKDGVSWKDLKAEMAQRYL